MADLGCGPGALVMRLAAAGYDAVGVDASAEAIGLARERGVRVLPGSLPREVPLEPGSCDGVILSDVLEHLDDDRGAVRAAAGLLRPGGVLICTVPAHPVLWTRRDEMHHHRRRYTFGAFGALFEGVGLERELVSYYNAGLFPVMAAARLAKRAIPRLDRAGPDIRRLPRGVNGALRVVFEAEKHVLARGRLPLGASLIAVHRRV